MRTIIAGSRDGVTYDDLLKAIETCPWEISFVVHGGCRGVDMMGERYAIENNIPFQVFHADWNTHGKGAGPIRNSVMSNHADALIAVRRSGKSSGTDDMIRKATTKGLKVHIHHVQA